MKEIKEKLRIFDNGSLIIENASRENAGKYECQATNSHGTASATVDVDVNGKSFENIYVYFILFSLSIQHEWTTL